VPILCNDLDIVGIGGQALVRDVRPANLGGSLHIGLAVPLTISRPALLLILCGVIGLCRLRGLILTPRLPTRRQRAQSYRSDCHQLLNAV
jgi:hypothetical protein